MGRPGDEDTTEIRSEATEGGPVARRVSVYHRDAVAELVVHPGAPLVIGRSDAADVTLRSARLSRKHARLGVDERGVWIEDLGSSNGTRVNGEAIAAPVHLAPGDRVELGSVVLTVPDPTSGSAHSLGLRHHEEFERELTDEIARARQFGRSFAVMMVESAGGGSVADWSSPIRGMLRPFDRLSLYGPGVLEVLRPECDAAEAREVAESLRACVEGPPGVRIGVAMYPDDGGHPSDLLGHALRCLRSGTGSEVVMRRPVEADDSRPYATSPRMLEVLSVGRRIARSNIPVLVLGETGAGKEVVAREIHRASHRADQPLHAVNCGSIPDSLVAGVLFGHERGAFTGADAARAGIFEVASGGTVLLDEIGELPLASQVTLLRVLDTGTVRRVGSTRDTPIDVRVIACTNRDLEAMAHQGTFRLDLLHRINAVTLEVPPLRERVDEIDGLVRTFLRRASHEAGRAVDRISEPAMSCLRRYPWPGNIRELRNVVDRAVVLAVGDTVQLEDLPPTVRLADRPTPLPVSRGSGPRLDATTLFGGADRFDLRAALAACEFALVHDALLAESANQSRAALRLRIPRRTLVYKLRAWADAPPDPSFDGLANSLYRVGDEVLAFKDRVAALEQRLMRQVLAEAEGDVERAAQRLGIPARVLAARI